MAGQLTCYQLVPASSDMILIDSAMRQNNLIG